MKILFLDIDGVLNSVDWYKRRLSRRDRPRDEIDPIALQRLVDVLKATGAYVVISSTWRKLYPTDLICKHFCALGMPEELIERFIDVTPVLKGFRGDEVQAWLDKHPEVKQYAIVDDDVDFHPHQHPYFVNTTHATGLLLSDVEDLMRILS